MLSPADIAEAVSSVIGLSAQQISAQDWIGQAHKLALQAAESKHQRTAVNAENLLEAVPVKDEPYKNVQTPATPLHDAIFTVEFSLNSDSTVRATHVLHIQTRHEMTWEGWQDTALLDFFALYGRLKLLQNESPPPVTKEIDAAQATALPTDVKREPVYTLNLQKLEILPHGADHHRHILLSEQLFDARLTLDWDMTALTADPLDYTVSLFAKKLGVQGYRGCIGEARGTVAPAKSAIIKVEGMTLPQGTYRLDAHLILNAERERTVHTVVMLPLDRR